MDALPAWDGSGRSETRGAGSNAKPRALLRPERARSFGSGAQAWDFDKVSHLADNGSHLAVPSAHDSRSALNLRASRSFGRLLPPRYVRALAVSSLSLSACLQLIRVCVRPSARHVGFACLHTVCWHTAYACLLACLLACLHAQCRMHLRELTHQSYRGCVACAGWPLLSCLAMHVHSRCMCTALLNVQCALNY